MHSSSPHLKKLSFGTWNMGQKGISSLSKGLRINFKLRELVLWFNQINDDAIESLVVPLSNQHCQVNTLDLSNNLIGDKGGFYISNYLKSNNNISKINLKNNMIECEGGKAIRDAIYNKDKNNLVVLNLNQNLVDIKVGEEIEDMVYGTFLLWPLDNKITLKKDVSRFKMELMEYRDDKKLLEKTNEGKWRVMTCRNWKSQEYQGTTGEAEISMNWWVVAITHRSPWKPSSTKTSSSEALLMRVCYAWTRGWPPSNRNWSESQNCLMWASCLTYVDE